jgi:hypothetical protein
LFPSIKPSYPTYHVHHSLLTVLAAEEIGELRKRSEKNRKQDRATARRSERQRKRKDRDTKRDWFIPNFLQVRTLLCLWLELLGLAAAAVLGMFLHPILLSFAVEGLFLGFLPSTTDSVDHVSDLNPS